MNWGQSIILVFILFAGFIGTLVVLMSRERIDLVRADYYQDEIAYQQHIDRVGNTARLNTRPEVTYLRDQQQVVLVLPQSFCRGEVIFYRPADQQQDFKVMIPAQHATHQVITTRTLARGHWRIKLSWSDGKQDYYTEETLFL